MTLCCIVRKTSAHLFQHSGKPDAVGLFNNIVDMCRYRDLQAINLLGYFITIWPCKTLLLRTFIMDIQNLSLKDPTY